MTLLDERLRNADWTTRTVQSLFRETCAHRGDDVAIFHNGATLTFAALQDEVDVLAASLLRRGLGAGDVVSVLPSPTPAFAAVFFAVLQTGATLNPLNLLWSRDELAAVLARNRPMMIVAAAEHGGRDHLAHVESALDGSAPQLVAVTDGGIGALQAHGDEGAQQCASRSARSDWERLADLQTVSLATDVRREILDTVERARSETPQFICQTSGSTNVSKSAVWTHPTALSTAHFASRALGLDENDRYLNLAPFYHNSGLCSSLIMSLAFAGIGLQLFDSFDPDEALDAAARNGLTVTFGFAAHWNALAASDRYSRSSFTLRRALLAGDDDLHKTVAQMCPPGAVLANLYAQTENGPLVALTEYDALGARRQSSNGRPLPGVELVIRDLTSDRPVPDGGAGEICYRSPFLFEGYLQEDGSTLRPLDDDRYFRSGDVGRLDEGYLTYIERLGSVVKSGGENVSLTRVTQQLQMVLGSEIDDVRAVAVPHEYWGSMVVALLRTDGTDDEFERRIMRDRCRQALAGYEIPQRFFRYPSQWPVSPEGKLDMKSLERFATTAVDEAQAHEEEAR